MIYLFNSGFSAFYRQNTLNTLYLPNQWANEYRYRERNLDVSDLELFKTPPIGEKVLISFVDRFARNGSGEPEYRYIPLRFGELLKVEFNTEQWFFTVKLLDFVCPRDIDAFQIILKSALKKYPRFVDNPENRDDGIYAVPASDIFQKLGDFKYGDDAWNSIIHLLKDTFAFNNPDPLESIPIFLKGKLFDDSNNIVEPKIENNNSYYELLREGKYNFQVNYSFPRYKENTHVSLEFKKGDNLVSIGETEIGLNNSSDTKNFHFTTRKIIEQSISSFNFKEIVPVGTKPILVAQKSHKYSIIESRKFNIEIVFIFLLFPLMGFIASSDLEEFLGLHLGIIFLKVAAILVQAFFLWRIFKLFGKRIF